MHLLIIRSFLFELTKNVTINLLDVYANHNSACFKKVLENISKH